MKKNPEQGGHHPERAEDRPEVRFTQRNSAFFEVQAPDKALRDLMHHIQTEGIVPQNSLSDSSHQPHRKFFLWVDEADKSKIEAWLREHADEGA